MNSTVKVTYSIENSFNTWNMLRKIKGNCASTPCIEGCHFPVSGCNSRSTSPAKRWERGFRIRQAVDLQEPASEAHPAL